MKEKEMLSGQDFILRPHAYVSSMLPQLTRLVTYRYWLTFINEHIKTSRLE